MQSNAKHGKSVQSKAKKAIQCKAKQSKAKDLSYDCAVHIGTCQHCNRTTATNRNEPQRTATNHLQTLSVSLVQFSQLYITHEGTRASIGTEQPQQTATNHNEPRRTICKPYSQSVSCILHTRERAPALEPNDRHKAQQTATNQADCPEHRKTRGFYKTDLWNSTQMAIKSACQAIELRANSDKICLPNYRIRHN